MVSYWNSREFKKIKGIAGVMNYVVYDFETSGRNARFDQILQAGIVVYDLNFQSIKKLNLKSRINPDVVPSINALRVNKLKICEILSEPKSYYEMTREMHSFLSQFKDSFFVGFNSINFDEEFFRQVLWEHFYFQYLTNTNGNARLDILNFATLVHAFRDNSINVEKNDEGKMTFKLESLARANSFESKNAHEAIADVETTMKLMEILKDRNSDLFRIIKENSFPSKLALKIKNEDIFTLHNYMFNNHRIYLVKFLTEHPVYNNQYIGFDLKYDSSQIIDLSYEELNEIYKNKSFFRKIKLNKQPSILDKSFAKNLSPYNEFKTEEIELKCKQLDNPDFKEKIKKILYKESIEYGENQTQEMKFEEETIYSKRLNYKDSKIMNNFHLESWENKWSFAEKFEDPRLRFFAARHIFRNFPNELPRKVFLFLHQKISERLCSISNQTFTSIPAAMEEADSLSLKMEEDDLGNDLKEQIEQYNIYINYLNDYYSNPKPVPVRFDEILSSKLYGKEWSKDD